MKSVHIRSFSGWYFPAFGLNIERYPVSLQIWSDSGKIRTRKLQIRTLFKQSMAGKNPGAARNIFLKKNPSE